MAGSTATSDAHAGHSEGTVSIPLVVGAAALVGIGLTGMTFWLITFQWVLLASVVPLVVGALLLFSRATGPDHA
ncbi:MAG: hypothetical protein ACLQD8_08055 [Thermoplasmata archaeon]